MKQPIVGFAGMTHLGINSAVATAERGFSIVCFDNNSQIIQKLKQKDLLVNEPELPELMAKNEDKLFFSDQIQDLSSCDIVYIASDVPTDDKGRSDLKDIEFLISQVSKKLKVDAVLVILCQVPPGFTRKLSMPLDRLYYQVETLIFGRAVERALYPERFIIGCSSPENPIPPVYRTVLNAFQCPILTMRYESAELAKISINCCLVASIGVANTLSEICENIGADWSEIVPALKLDKRIGQYSYLTPGLGIAGGNLERDLTTVLELSAAHGTEVSIVAAWIKNSQYRRDWVLRVLFEKLLIQRPESAIGVLGLAYKEDTNSVKNSPAISLLNCLKSYKVRVYDPVVSAQCVSYTYAASSVLDVLEGIDVLVIMTPWQIFKNLDPEIMAEKMKGKLVIDPYRVLSANITQMQELKFNYFSLGVS